jgi:hypothetical protein
MNLANFAGYIGDLGRVLWVLDRGESLEECTVCRHSINVVNHEPLAEIWASCSINTPGRRKHLCDHHPLSQNPLGFHLR